MRRVARISRDADDRRRRCRSCLGGRRLAVAGPVHRPVHEVPAAQAGGEVRAPLRRLPPAGLVRPVTTLPDGTVSVAAERKNIAAAGAAYRRTLHARRPGRAADRASPRPEVDRRQRDESRRPDPWARAGAVHVHAGPERADLRRRPPHHLPGAVRAHRQPAAGRPDHLRRALRDVRVRGHRPPDRPGRRPLGPALPRQGAADPAGVPPPLLRDAPLPRLREARPGEPAARAAVRARRRTALSPEP